MGNHALKGREQRGGTEINVCGKEGSLKDDLRNNVPKNPPGGFHSPAKWSYQLFGWSPLPRLRPFVKLKYVRSGRSPRAPLIEARSAGAKEAVKVSRTKWGGGRDGNENLLSFSC